MQTQAETGLPKMPRLAPVSILRDEFGIQAGRVTLYDYAEKMPDYIKVRFGKRLFLKVDELTAWIQAGGTSQAS